MVGSVVGTDKSACGRSLAVGAWKDVLNYEKLHLEPHRIAPRPRGRGDFCTFDVCRREPSVSLISKCYYRLCQSRVGRAMVRPMVRGVRRVGLLREFCLPIDALELDPDCTAALMRLWRKMHWGSSDGMMPPKQLLAIYRLAARWPVDGDVVELGAWTGLTTSYLATACRVRGDGHVYAVDTFKGDMEGGGHYDAVDKYHGTTLPAFSYRMAQTGLIDYVSTMIGDTAAAAAHYSGRPIRLLLIDADHSYEGVQRDFQAWAPKLALGGLIVFHDYLMPEAGVARFVDEVVAANPAFVLAPGHVTPNVLAVMRRMTAPADRARSLAALHENVGQRRHVSRDDLSNAGPLPSAICD